jgi:dTMP kinase
MYILLEGCDGTGKSSVIKELEKHYISEGRKVKLFFDPGISNTEEHKKWQDIRNFIKYQDMSPETETLMFMAIRAELMVNVNKALKEDCIVIQDRGSVSTEIYQGAIKGEFNLVEDLTHLLDFNTPDITFILSVPFEVLTERLESRFKSDDPNKDKFKSNKEFRHRVWKEYEKYANSSAAVWHNQYKINADRDINKVVKTILKKLPSHE